MTDCSGLRVTCTVTPAVKPLTFRERERLLVGAKPTDAWSCRP